MTMQPIALRTRKMTEVISIGFRGTHILKLIVSFLRSPKRPQPSRRYRHSRDASRPPSSRRRYRSQPFALR